MSTRSPRSLYLHHSWRRVANVLMWVLAILATLIALTPLVMVMVYLLKLGLPSLNLAFFIHLPKPVGEVGGGMANAIVGTLVLVGLACVFGIPFGLLGGVYLAEFGTNRIAQAIRFCADVLASVPSIVIGVFVYTLVVIPMHIGFTALSGGVALGILMIPTVMRTTEELLRMVPTAQRDAALSLGATHLKTVFTVVLPAARAGVITGVLLAVARIAGETAPLIFTALGNNYWSVKLTEPIAALPLQIYKYATTASDDWISQAWTGALVLVFLILILGIAARYATRGRIRIVR